MIKRSRPLQWDKLNFIGLVLVVVLALLYLSWPQKPSPPSPYWFVSYEWIRGKERGAGRRCIVVDKQGFDIVKVEDSIIEKNKYDSLILNNFIQIDKTTYDLCTKQP